MIPFRVSLRPGSSICEQIVYAAKKTIVSREMLPGESFPSVRTLSKELKINPNTAHKVITQLVFEGILAVQPGLGTVVAEPRSPAPIERSQLLNRELEELAVEALRIGLELGEVVAAIERHWERLVGTHRSSRKET